MPNMEQKDWSGFAEGGADKNGWRTIESAPRDGEIILLVQGAVFAGKYMTWGPYVGFWSSRPEDNAHPWRFYDGTCPTNGWQEANGPTHWQPLPAPPEPSHE